MVDCRVLRRCSLSSAMLLFNLLGCRFGDLSDGASFLTFKVLEGFDTLYLKNFVTKINKMF